MLLECNENEIIARVKALGACACGVVRADTVDEYAQNQYSQWLAREGHGTMQYCRRNCEVRNDPRLLLSGCKWLIVCAFNYNPGPLPNNHLRIARYALGRDYHHVLPERLAPLEAFLKENYGGETRVAVDTLPLRERYWAVRAGLGYIGRNNQLIVPGIGSYVFIATILWTGEIKTTERNNPTPPSAKATPEDKDEHVIGDAYPSGHPCSGCRACLKACPTRALQPDGSCLTERCVSYLTIEHKGNTPPDIDLRGWIYGCDLCQMACPHNRTAPLTNIPEFQPRPELLNLTPDILLSHSGRSWQRFLGDSAMLRTPLRRLIANLPLKIGD